MGILARFRKPGTATLYDTIGGRDALEVVVEDFYCRVLDDDLLAGFYAGADMKRVKAKQVEFLSSLLGGSVSYSGLSMRQAHEGRGITMHHFAMVAAHLADSLCAAGLHPDTITEILRAVAPLAGDIASDDIKAVV
ncbi:group 1 truncated hemoglobin GlbN [Mycobacterium cookii]|uniref:Group 1 truncated hemoglobin n=1 Tax=Mycobacterium cookii TaxID=1775 RepID=A0A7I7KSI4_9MYCO|nr:group 1 truncated hemoglobin [Mycobacterium cookii]MCV7332190.1 group 1 truncated hemoglobin [Mycobacterium cookii]BBX44551.1 group 1 truncated hemoglobin GlbN [Mycobacterium cookii]